MCGRFAMQAPPNEITATFKRYKALFEPDPRYNVAPTQRVMIAKNDGADEITHARWGLIPAWSKDPNPKIQPINAKLETVAESRMFAPLLRSHRCLIFADGFFEWKREGKTRRPIFFRLKSRKPFAFAGLWTTWHDEVTSCTLLTGPPNELVAPIHDRMPMMLDPTTYEAWASREASVEDALATLGPYPPHAMESFEVGAAVNSPRRDDPSVLKPVSAKAP